MVLLCSSRRNPYPPTSRERGVLKVNILEAKYEAKPEFPGGTAGVKQTPSKTLIASMGGVWIFSGTAHFPERQSRGPSFEFNMDQVDNNQSCGIALL